MITTPSFDIVEADVISNASTIFLALAGVAALVMGFRLGLKLLKNVVRLI